MKFKSKNWLLASSLMIGMNYSAATFAFSFGELFGFSSSPKQEQTTSDPEQEIKQIDQEILILRAELAVKNNDLKALEKYLNELDESGVLPMFQTRYQQLRAHLGQIDHKRSPSLFEFLGLQGGAFEVDLYSPSAVAAIVLPMSGDYKSVGTQLAASIKTALQRQGFKGQILQLDTEQYPNLYVLWQSLRNYNPSLIFGPLQKLSIEAWHDLRTGVPTVYFNDVPIDYDGNEKSLSPSRIGGIPKLTGYLQQNFYKGALVLREDSPQGLQAIDQLIAENQDSLNPISIYEQVVSKSVDDGIESGLGISASKQRAATLRRSIRRSLNYVPRARQDFDVLISLLSAQQAVQISPYLDLYQLREAKHLWYSPQTPKKTDLSLYQTSWQETYAFLPDYLYQSYQQTVNLRPKTNTGIFHALGTAAVEILTFSDQFNQQKWFINTSVGQVETQPNGQFYLLPSVYLLDKAKVTPLVTD